MTERALTRRASAMPSGAYSSSAMRDGMKKAHNASRLLVLGSILAAILLVLWAHWLAHREMNRRRDTEAQLQAGPLSWRRS